MTAKKNPSLSKREALSLAWKSRKDYKGYDRSKGSSFNSWRSITNTTRGRAAGFPDTWRDYNTFLSEVQGTWVKGMIVCRLDTTLPHSPENSFWAEKGTESSGKLVRMEYEGVTKTLLEFSEQFGLNYQGVRQRYFKGKRNGGALTPKEILFGRERQVRNAVDRDRDFRTRRKVGAYRLRDRKKGLENDLTNSYAIEQVSKGCVYCGSLEDIGLDRIDNSKGHTKANTVPCCYTCNCARNDNFSYEEMLELGKVIKRIKGNRDENRS